MCGRFVATSTPDAIADYFGATATVAPLDVNFNVAPTHAVYGVVARATDPDTPLDKTVRAFRWGLIPSWANDHRIGARMINARAETLKQKPSFRDLVKNRRVIIPMDGFYEWKLGVANGPGNAGGVPLKQPMYIHSVDGSPLAVAGLRATWKDPSDPNHRWLHSTTLITTAANDLMSLVHDRMPVLIPRDRWDDWLNPNYDNIDALSDIFTATNDSILKMHAVSAKVNDVRNNAPDLLAEI